MKRIMVLAAIGTMALALTGCPTTDYTMTNGGADTPAPKGKVHKLDFESAKPGDLPPDFAHVLGEWKVQAGPDWKILRQDGAYHTNDFPRVILKDTTFTNVHVKVKCAMLAGSTDKACGIMLRVQNSDNYFLTRANALEDNIRLYKIVDGDRQELASAGVSVKSDDWHVYEIFTEGNRFRILWDGKEVLTHTDGTFVKGKVGLWTKADSVTAFDDFEATEQ